MKQKGQIVLEYILLLIVAVTLAALLTSQMVQHSTNPEDSGLILRMWNSITRAIGADYSDGPTE